MVLRKLVRSGVAVITIWSALINAFFVSSPHVLGKSKITWRGVVCARLISFSIASAGDVPVDVELFVKGGVAFPEP
ncbi:MAG: hypothetical protein DCO81_07065 [Candidatus Aquiluna sp. XM-24bin5]|nr:MAG: hypothetical protein DCO81_07065 [Candidatus Aquiluna sp. XM-24bin5]